MGRRTQSYSPPPSRGYGSRVRSPSPRGRYDSRGRDLPTSLLVRNIRRDCRPEDLRRPFGRFGPLKDIYLPRDYYTGEPRGFGFVQYMDPADAAEAKYYMDRQNFHGREITVVFAEERRKKPDDMRRKERTGRRVDYGRHYSPYGVRSRSRSQSPGYNSPHRERFSRFEGIHGWDGIGQACHDKEIACRFSSLFHCQQYVKRNFSMTESSGEIESLY